VSLTVSGLTGCFDTDVDATADASGVLLPTDQVKFESFPSSDCLKATGSAITTQTVPGPGSPPGTFGPVSLTLDTLSGGCFDIRATATNSCGTATNDVVVNRSSFCFRASGGAVIWSSDLAKGTRLQLVVNGSAAFYPTAGRSVGAAAAIAGTNRMEATVAETDGKAGLWRFELSPSGAAAPGSLRVVTGDVVLITDTTVTFRLQGKAGERIVFTFQEK